VHKVSSNSARNDVLISVDDLPDALNAGAQLLDVRWELTAPPGTGHRQYLDGHLPAARFADLEYVFTGLRLDRNDGRHPLPDAERIGMGLGALGIDPERPIVVYDRPGSFAAARAWWVLRWAGLNALVLDGGFPAWQASGGAVETGEVPPPAQFTTVTVTTGHLPTIATAELADFAGTVIDVRTPERYRGDQEPIDARAGHIPGAVNRPVPGFWDANGRLPEQERLDELLQIPMDREVVAYCGSGVSAAQVVFALASLGIEATLYAPGWSGWSADPSRPTQVGDQA
jgi:thiosulfate/3-mercaptopyruvate sulfurtransferase